MAGIKCAGSEWRLTPDGKSFTCKDNEVGRVDAFLANQATMRPEKINFPAGLHSFSGNPTPFSASGDRVLVNHESSVHPGDVWVYDTSRRHPTQLTFSAIATLETSPLSEPSAIHYKTLDGQTISQFL